MRIALVFPNYAIRDQFGEPSDPPLGIASIAAVLEEKGYPVTIIDANAENLSMEDIASRLIRWQPNVVGICCNYSPLHNPTREIAAMVKMKLNLPVIVGGNHATALVTEMLEECRDIDYVVRGEGEVILPELLHAFSDDPLISHVRGISFREGDRIIHNPDAPLIARLDDLPIPAYHLLPMEKYRRYNIITSRGCPFGCTYCASDVIFRRKVRYRSPKSVVDEITFLLERYGEKHFWFSDDTFITNSKYTHSLLDELMKRDLHISWSCLMRVDKVSGELLERMKRCGCSYISYGIESGSQEMLNKMEKRTRVEDILETLKMTHDRGIKHYGFFLVGLPGESWSTVMESYRLIYQSRLNGAAFNILIPLPGTPLMNTLLGEKLISLKEIQWDFLFARTPHETYQSYAAGLAARWSELSAVELMEACNIGHRLPEIFRHVTGSFCEKKE